MDAIAGRMPFFDPRVSGLSTTSCASRHRPAAYRRDGLPRRSHDGATRNLGMRMPGEAVSIPLDQAGECAVRCGIHPQMNLSVNLR